MARTKAGAKKQAAAPPPGPVTEAPAAAGCDALGSVELTMTAELGRTQQTIGAVSELGDQSLITFDRRVGEPIDVLLNGRLFARGEVVTIGESFGVRVTEIIQRP